MCDVVLLAGWCELEETGALCCFAPSVCAYVRESACPYCEKHTVLCVRMCEKFVRVCAFVCVRVSVALRTDQSRSRSLRSFQTASYYVSRLKGEVGRERMHRCTFGISGLWTQPITEEPKSQHLSLRLWINATSWSPVSEYQRQDEVLRLIPGSGIKHILNPAVFILIQSCVGQQMPFDFGWRFSLCWDNLSRV